MFLICLFSTFIAAIPDVDWNYVQVRTGSYLFYWMYGYNGSSIPREQAPWVMWLQGGPGAGSSGYGNILEIGPFDINGNSRNTTWVNQANVVFLDQPVGSGFSYTTNNGYVTNNQEIANDIVTFMKSFLQTYPEAQTAPFFIFSESYGGKMNVQAALALLQAVDAGQIKLNLRGIALGDSWISPIDFVDTWGPYLRDLSLMESNELQIMNEQAVTPCDQAVANQQWANATNYWGNTENYVSQYACVDFYNVLDVDCGSSIYGNKKQKPLLSSEALSLAPEGIDHQILDSLYRRHVYRIADEDITTYMNTVIRQQLKIIPADVTWGGQSGQVFSVLSGDFMRPVVSVVDTLLSMNRINVTVYEGQLDLICATVGADLWMTRLTWEGMSKFYSSTKVPLSPFSGGPTGAFKRTNAPLNMYKVMNAGHLLPSDNPDMASGMLADILSTQI